MIFIWKIFVYGLIFLKYLENYTVLAGIHENKLLEYLFNSARSDAHNSLERPVANETEPVPVRFGTTLTQILDVDEKNQIIKTSIMLLIMWRDYHFQWNPDDYGGIRIINVHLVNVWKPDVLLYNSADDNFNAANPVNINIYNDGRISYTPPGLFKSTCEIDVTWFPFDKQRCILKFGTWSYDGLSVDLKINCPNDEFMLNNGNCSNFGKVDLQYYTESGEWKLLNTELRRYIKKYTCCPEVYIDVKMIMEIQRKALYYIFNFVLPCIIITIVELLDFMLPSDAGEKISLGVTIMLSLSMFQLIVADRMPQSSLSVPLLAVYFASMMALSSLSIFFTVLVLSCHHNDHEIPKVLKVFVNQWLSRALFIAPLNTQQSQSDKEQSEIKMSPVEKRINSIVPISAIANSKTSTSLLANVLDLSSDTHNIYQGYSSRKKSLTDYENELIRDFKETSLTEPPRDIEEQEDQSSSIHCSLQDDLSVIRWHMEFVTEKIKESDEESDLLKEWKFAAYVIDRFCLVSFSLLVLAMTGAIFTLGANY